MGQPTNKLKSQLTYAERSTLYKALEEKDWDKALKRAKTNPEEAQVWQETDPTIFGTKNGVGRELCMHAALRLDAPKDVIFAVLNAYSDALKGQDGKGRIPLHLLMHERTVIDQELVDLFLKIYDAGTDVKDKEGKIPLAIYNKNTTQLYRFIESKNWDMVVRHLKTNPAEGATWVFRKEKDGSLRWKLSPLHAALIYDAPAKVIAALIKAYPHGAKQVDDEGMLPIHLAFRNGCEEKIVDLLLEAHPEGVRELDSKGQVPFAHSRTIQSNRKGVVEKYTSTVVKLEKQDIVRDTDAFWETKLKEENTEWEEKVSNIKGEYDTDKAKMKKVHEEKMKELKADYEEKMKKLSGDYQKQITTQKSTQSSAAKKIESDYEYHLKIEKEKYEKESKELKDNLTQKLKETEDVVGKQKSIIDQLRQQVLSLEGELDLAKNVINSRKTAKDQVLMSRDEDDVTVEGSVAAKAPVISVTVEHQPETSIEEGTEAIYLNDDASVYTRDSRKV